MATRNWGPRIDTPVRMEGMVTLEPPNTHFLSAAEGWLELGDAPEARAELDLIQASFQEHPEVLKARWAICAHERDWPAALALGGALVASAPEHPLSWLHQAYALRRVPEGGLQAAWDCLSPALEKFPEVSIIPYHLACYACQLGQMEKARKLLKQAMKAGEKQHIKHLALDDADLQAALAGYPRALTFVRVTKRPILEVSRFEHPPRRHAHSGRRVMARRAGRTLGHSRARMVRGKPRCSARWRVISCPRPAGFPCWAGVLGNRTGAISAWHIGLVSSSIRQLMADTEPALETIVSGKYAMIDYWGSISRDDRARGLQLLKQIECSHLAERPWLFLSQGERRSACSSGRALMARPRLLILDEPCAGLDPAAREHFLQFVQRLGRRADAPTLVLVTHHVEEIMPVFSHALILKSGEVLASGEKKSRAQRPQSFPRLRRASQIEQPFRALPSHGHAKSPRRVSLRSAARRCQCKAVPSTPGKRAEHLAAVGRNGCVWLERLCPHTPTHSPAGGEGEEGRIGRVI